LGEQICEAKITGAHNFQNIITALCVGKFFEVTEKDALDAVLQYNPDNQRSQIVERGSILLLLDSYNANPDSMIAALKNLSNFDKPKKIALIGEMSELGTETVRMHASVLSAIVEEKIGIDEVICCGKVFEAAIQSNLPPNTPVRFFETDEKMKEHLQKTDFSNCAVLVKASRSQAYERFADCIGERTERAEA
jgi:UDP-N-acetylmuramoyl-tripeptide--D-alanyl-D-alanine ligase